LVFKLVKNYKINKIIFISRKEENGDWRGRFWNYPNISALDVKCMALQGMATTLIPYLVEDRSQ